MKAHILFIFGVLILSGMTQASAEALSEKANAMPLSTDERRHLKVLDASSEPLRAQMGGKCGDYINSRGERDSGCTPIVGPVIVGALCGALIGTFGGVSGAIGGAVVGAVAFAGLSALNYPKDGDRPSR